MWLRPRHRAVNRFYRHGGPRTQLVLQVHDAARAMSRQLGTADTPGGATLRLRAGERANRFAEDPGQVFGVGGG
jgi:hypothetical protein